MIESARSDILEDDVEALVNTVNTVGVMGKGIALQFKQAFPKNFKAYQRACKRGDVRIGQMFTFRTGLLSNPILIINFPTKQDWRKPSKIEYIRDGMASLITVIQTYGIKSVAIPPLGAGSGGLDWGEVRPIIESAARQVPNVRVLIHDPVGAPAPRKMLIATKRPNMTQARAVLIAALERYAVPGYRLALIEIQKLAYFLQLAGEPLKLQFHKGKYGPYAETLHYVLQHIEGHFIRGYGDRTQVSPIELLADGISLAHDLLARNSETQHRLDQVSQLIEGYETPYGLELLASVHWVSSTENSLAKESPEFAIDLVHQWSKRKAERFNSAHIRQAWQRLYDHEWMSLVP